MYCGAPCELHSAVAAWTVGIRYSVSVGSRYRWSTRYRWATRYRWEASETYHSQNILERQNILGTNRTHTKKKQNRANHRIVVADFSENEISGSALAVCTNLDPTVVAQLPLPVGSGSGPLYNYSMICIRTLIPTLRHVAAFDAGGYGIT